MSIDQPESGKIGERALSPTHRGRHSSAPAGCTRRQAHGIVLARRAEEATGPARHPTGPTDPVDALDGS
ncbi:hypothetical protein [Streptomyces sp. SID13726]|uniref:hypothetical protein n=1 Tax=Streptomyces sp. SID13726 TaxID=2706058 RepID=UPI0013BAD611|nr:hypothetical protein [Streptomyces sp. SID13726]NEB02608.1 hypothetical protein [Streptomyces sp. SID13726]